LLALPINEFWAHRKEVAELLRFRVRGADALALDRLVQRIVAGPVVSAEIEDPEAVKDAYRWVYLASLDLAIEPLPDAAQNALQSIKNRRQWQDRKLEEQDLFWSWSYGMRRGLIGDPTPIADDQVENRLEIASELERTDRLNQNDVWRVYCESDPEGALESLLAVGQVPAHTRRWRDLLWAIPNIGTESDGAKARGRTLVARATEALQASGAEQLAELVHPLADLLVYASGADPAIVEDRWDWLWRCAATHERAVAESKSEKDSGFQLISQAINSASGKLARLMVNRFGPSPKSRGYARRNGSRGCCRAKPMQAL
jgi:hypothetical protein